MQQIKMEDLLNHLDEPKKEKETIPMLGVEKDISKDKILAIELFGGIGAATQALKRTFGKDKVKIVDYVELDKHAVRSYNAINGTTFVSTDINDIDMASYPEVDVVIAGWPCQDYSVAGKGLGLEGTRSNLILLTIAKIKEMVNRPKHILLENVKGLLSKKHIDDLEYIKQLFDELGYNWDQAMLNSKYFGVPQSRERVFMLLTRKDLPMKTVKQLEERKTVDKVLRDILDFTEPTQTVSLTEMVAYNEKNIVLKDNKMWWRLSDGSLREILKIKEPNGTINVPHSKNFTNNVMGTPDGQMPTLMAGSTRYIIIPKYDYGKGVKFEYSNYIYLPPSNPEKPLNNLEGRRLWKSDKFVGTIPAGQSPKVYFTNKMSQYYGKVIELDINKLNNQDRDKINKVATLGTLEGIDSEQAFKTNDFGAKDRVYGIDGQHATATATDIARSKIAFKDHSFNQKKHFLGVDGVAKTLRAGDCDAENKIAFEEIPFNQDKSVHGVNGQAPTLTTTGADFKAKIAYPNEMIIHYRKLSTLECWRLMGFGDDAHNQCKQVGVSNSQLAKQAGNSIVVNVLEAIFKEIFND